MKRKIRIGMFETNSSSTHSMIITTKENYDKWENKELYYVDSTYGMTESAKALKGDRDFVTYDEVKQMLEGFKYAEGLDLTDDEAIKEWLEDYDNDTFYSMEHWVGEDLECDSTSYTCPDGTKIVAFAKYGTDY